MLNEMKKLLKKNLQPFPENEYCNPGWGFQECEREEQEIEEQEADAAEELLEELEAAEGSEELRASM